MNPDHSITQPCQSEKKRISPVHFYYIIAILLAVIILLMSVDWGTNTTLANTLNFALGLTSLVLSLVAIIYAFVSNHAFAGTASKIETAASSVKDGTSRLENSLRELQTALKEIPISLSDIKGGITKTQEMVMAKSSQQASQEPPPPQPTSAAEIEKFVNAVIDYYMNASSWNGLKIMYLCLHACQKQLKVDFKEWTSTDPSISYDYAYGYLIASASAAFVTINDDGTGKIAITSMPQPVANKIIPTIDHRIKTSPVPQNKIFQEQIENIDAFLAKSSPLVAKPQ